MRSSLSRYVELWVTPMMVGGQEYHDNCDGGETAVELTVDPAKFRDVVAANLPAEQTAVMAATQHPIAELAFSELCGPPAWKSRPVWAVVATGDKAAGTDVTRSQAERAGATITEVEGPHVIMISQPEVGGSPVVA